jgi:NAD+ diphosphatase
MPYPELVNLPFNFSSIQHDFKMRMPSLKSSTDPGNWAIIQGNSLVVMQLNGDCALPEGNLPAWLAPQQNPLCIGIWQGHPLRAFSIASSLALEEPFVAEAFNAATERLDIRTLTLGGLAKQILHWDHDSRHCSRCGGATESIAGSWGKRCSACSAEHYPHIHPCAIVLVKRGNELLLTRKREWPTGRYSLVAGFLDFGESLEECAIREIREETGILAKNIRYVGSQNWPFPAQLMAGFVADYDDGEIVVELNELEDARWFPVDALPGLPAKRSIARWIIDRFAI